MLTVRASPPYYYASVYALDPATFFAVTNPEPWYFRETGPDAARQILATPGQVLVTETYLQNAFLAVGDRIPLQSPVYNGTSYSTVTVNTTIGGTVRGLPGTGSYGFGLPNAIYGSADTFGPLLGSDQSLPPQFPRYGERYLVALHAGVDWRAAKAVLTAYLSTTLISAGPGAAGEALVPMLFTIPVEALLLLVLAPAAMLLTSFAVTIRVARMDIARVLKLRGG